MFSFFKQVPHIATTDLAARLTRTTTVLDVRTPVEFKSGHIKGAKNIPLHVVETYVGNKTEPLYVICQSGMRSKQAVKRLQRLGYQAINVTGGMNQWRGKLK
ncbi:rhodanese-like domain-containing protein [Brochothrix campestris]|uniref:Rhodanese family protein n=1 Tax=Brochothrix campestris FSL F6-1037 TaxID=1265861 RepID=W7CN94_9LIST|nr:rhodanese-like domain-containing protein [Brochothrix campestris]EUJ37121.1 rhodanese family protein [Brochothrix campestris FSL F6-1037]